MAKRAKNDATMDVSASQLVPDAPRPRAPRAPVPPNDMSVWKQVVVGTDDFAPPPKVRPGRSRRWVLAGAVGAVVGSGAAFAWYEVSSSSSPSSASAPAAAEEPAKPVAAAAPTPAPVPAPAKPAEAALAEPAGDPAPAAPTWFDDLAASLTREPTWFDELRAGFASVLSAPSVKKPGGKRTAASAKKPPVAPPKKKPAAGTTTTTKHRP